MKRALVLSWLTGAQVTIFSTPDLPNSCPTRPPPVTSACHHLARVENAKNSPARNVHQVNHLQKQPITLGLQAQHASVCLSETRRPALAALGLSRVPLTCTECRLRATALAAGERHSRKSGRRWDGEGSRGMARDGEGWRRRQDEACATQRSGTGRGSQDTLAAQRRPPKPGSRIRAYKKAPPTTVGDAFY